MWHTVYHTKHNHFDIVAQQLGEALIFRIYAKRFVPGCFCPTFRTLAYPGLHIKLEVLKQFLDKFRPPLGR